MAGVVVIGLLLALLAGCAEAPCDVRVLAQARSGGGVDCGSPAPYDDDGRIAGEHRVDCMVDAVLDGVPFFGAWLEGCELDACRLRGRAFDGDALWVLEQDLLDGAAGQTGFVRSQTCAPVVDERIVETPSGPALRRELRCGEVLQTVEIDPGSCPTVVWSGRPEGAPEAVTF